MYFDAFFFLKKQEKMNFGIFNILFRYVTKNFLLSFAIVFFCFFLVTSLLEIMEVVRRIPHGHSCFGGLIIELVVLKGITTISSFFSFTVFVSVVLFYIFINNRLELTAIRGFGLSPFQILKCLIFSTALLGAFYMGIIDGVSALSVEHVKKLERQVFHDEQKENSKITVTNTGLWFKDKNENNSYIIYAESFDKHSEAFLKVRFFKFDSSLNFLESIHAQKATINSRAWRIRNALIVDTNGVEKQQNDLTIRTKLSLRGVNKMTADPKSISIWNLAKYAKMLENVGLSTLRYRIQWCIQISNILQMISLVMLASLFCISYNHRNPKKYTIKVIGVTMMAFPIHFLNNILIALGTNETIPVFASTFALPCLFTVLFWILMHKSRQYV